MENDQQPVSRDIDQDDYDLPHHFDSNQLAAADIYFLLLPTVC